MAGTATAAYSSDVWTSPSSVDTSQQQWEFSVPIRQDSTRHRSKSRSRSSQDAKSRDRGSKGSRSSSMSRYAYTHEPAQYSRGRQDAGAGSRESETGGLWDSTAAPYGNSSIRKGDISGGGAHDEMDSENWIHRDKLARIESEELHQILLQRRPGTGSIRVGRGRSRDHGSVSGAAAMTPSTTEPLEPWPDLQEEQRSYAASPVPVGGEVNHDPVVEERKHWDLRRPEEIAAEMENHASNIYRNPGLRKSSSRIPVPTTSPLPLPLEQTDREFPIQRSRALTNGEEDTLSSGLPRRASEPLTADSVSTSSPHSDSRPGSGGVQPSSTATKKTPAKSGSTSRKTSAPPATRKITPRNRATSSNNTQRPITRSGEIRPPTAVNRPEGDPPWLATMYKPDPRLPPDQQILPTHARRMQQEQWVKEGKTPTTYDREFAPLAIAPEPSSRVGETAQKEEEEEEEEKREKLEIQLEPPKVEGLGLNPIPKSPEPGTRPNTATGYSPMPKVQDTPPTTLTPKWNTHQTQTIVTAQSPPDDKADKGCGCCIVM